MVKGSILIVEDESITGLSIKYSLKQFGYQVVDIVSSGMKAIDKARENHPDLVLMDIDLDGEMDGVETAKQIFNRFDIPIVYLTAYSEAQILQRAVQTEPFGYILKPFSKETLLVSIETALHKYRAEKALKESEADLKIILDSSPQIQILVDRNHKIRDYNKAASERLKLISGKPIERGCLIHKLVEEEAQGKFKETILRVLQGQSLKVTQFVMSGGRKQRIRFYYTPIFDDDCRVTKFCIYSVDNAEAKATSKLLSVSEQQLLTEMQSILFTTEELVNSTSLKNLLDLVTTQVRHLTNSNGAAVLMLSNDKEHLKVVSSSSLDSNVEVGLQVPIKGSIAEAVLVTHKVQSCSYPKDYQARPIGKFLFPSKVVSLLCVPLEVRDEMLGMLLSWSKNKNFSNERDNLMLHSFADRVALALYNANIQLQNRQRAVEQERNRLARELHDSVTQSLYTIGMAAQAALKYANQGLVFKAKKSVELIHSLSKTALSEIRTNLYDLRSTVVDEKQFAKALEYYCDSLKKQFDFKVELVIDSNIRLTGSQVEHLYYIVREGLWNAVKYSHTNRAKVILSKETNDIILMIKDKGGGFIYSSSDNLISVGLQNLKQRVDLLQGSFTVETKPDRGTQIRVRIPLR